VGDESLTALLVHCKDFHSAVIFDEKGSKVACNESGGEFSESDLQALTELFGDRDKAIGGGACLGGHKFDLHRYHPPLVYGRRGDPHDGEGICVARGERNGKECFAVITYRLPVISSVAIPQLVQFFRKYVGELEQWDPIMKSTTGLPSPPGPAF